MEILLSWVFRVSFSSLTASLVDDMDSFVSGVLNFFTAGRKARRIEVHVANPYNVNVGCGEGTTNCLGAGSLELIIDGVKHVVGGD
jgi:hypothetical protein